MKGRGVAEEIGWGSPCRESGPMLCSLSSTMQARENPTKILSKEETWCKRSLWHECASTYVKGGKWSSRADAKVRVRQEVPVWWRWGKLDWRHALKDPAESSGDGGWRVKQREEKLNRGRQFLAASLQLMWMHEWWETQMKELSLLRQWCLAVKSTNLWSQTGCVQIPALSLTSLYFSFLTYKWVK